MEELLTDYELWVANHSCWEQEVLDNPIGFGKKLRQLLAAKGWPHIAIRKKGVRGIAGLARTQPCVANP